MVTATAPTLKTYRHPWLAHRSYLILDPRSGTAAVVDPIRNVDPYLKEAKAGGCRIRHVFLTRLHPGHETGHVELRGRAEALIHVGAWARLEVGSSPLKDGDVLEFGDVRLQILETPGRTLDAISILYFDLTIDSRSPLAVLTGDTLRVGDVGTPDLPSSGPLSCHEMAGMLYGSLQGKLLTLPGKTRVYPGHDAAAPCIVPEGSGGLWSTIDLERSFNHALQPMSRSAFARMICDGRSKPSRGARKQPDLLHPLSLKEFLLQQEAGLPALDLRGEADYAAAHLDGSLFLGLRGPFRDWAGLLLDSRRPVGLIADPAREIEAARQLRRLKIPVSGFLRYGMESFENRPELLRRTPRITAAALAADQASDRPLGILDVRNVRERRGRRIDGSLHIPLDELVQRRRELPRTDRIVICCSNGYRSTIAAGLLEREGIQGATVLIGGMAAWELGR